MAMQSDSPTRIIERVAVRSNLTTSVQKSDRRHRHTDSLAAEWAATVKIPERNVRLEIWDVAFGLSSPSNPHVFERTASPDTVGAEIPLQGATGRLPPTDGRAASACEAFEVPR